MKRRDFITLVGGAAAGWPLAARAQPVTPPLPLIGYLDGGSAAMTATLVTAFREGLSEMGYVEGRNVLVDYRYAEDQNERLPKLAADLVGRNVVAIAAPGASAPALALKAQTATIPIIFSMGADPVRLGLVSSLNRPGGNITGIVSMAADTADKRLELMCRLLPGATRLALLTNPTVALAQAYVTEFHAAGAILNRQTEVFYARTNVEIDSAFANLVKYRADGLSIRPDTLFINRRAQIVGLTIRHGIPAIFPFRQDAEFGGLMSYGPDLRSSYRLVGTYTGRVLRGDKPADLPVMRHDKFELIINLQTAKTLGVEAPPTLLALADEVIE
jgi:putative ABC transport system substrate-binding protein